MRRFYQPAGPDENGRLILDGVEANHAAKVIRLRPGEAATVLDGRGAAFDCFVVEVDRRRVVLQVDRRIDHPLNKPQLKLYQSVLKGKAFDSVIQKSVELGASEIVPILSDRVVSKIDAACSTGKLDKWNQIAVEAIKQSGAPWLPTILGPTGFEQALRSDQSTEFRLVASLESNASVLRERLDSFVNEKECDLAFG